MRNVFILSFLHLTAVSSSTLITVLTKCRFFTVYLLGTGWSVWPRSVKGNFSWKNSSKLNKVINEETAFKFVTAWEESYDVTTRPLSIRHYTFMKKSVAIQLENSKELNIFYQFKLWKCIYWKNSLKNYSKSKWFSCMFSFHERQFA